MATITWTLTEEEIEDFDLPDSAIDVEVIEEYSYSREVRGVFPDADGNFWRIAWEEDLGDNESGCGPWDRMTPTATRVEKKQVTVEKWIAVDA